MAMYARPVQIGEEVRMVDVFDAAIYEPRPAWGQTDANLLDHIFVNSKAVWVAVGQWFISICAGVQSGAVHRGDDFQDPTSYVNPGGTDANGNISQNGPGL